MKKRIYSIITLSIISIMVTSCGENRASFDNPKKLFEYVLDIGTISNFDENKAMKIFQDKYFVSDGGCSAVVTQVNGNNIVGRNMDLTLQETSILKFELDINKYKSIGIAYPRSIDSLDYKKILKNGFGEYEKSILPIIGLDYLNEKGLYVETNMRSWEENHEVTSTNLLSKNDVYLLYFPAYVASRCANINEVLELIEDVNFYNNISPEKGSIWNFAFTLADAEGNYGVLEIAKNKVSFLSKQNGQANFYITPEFAEGCKYQCGEPRFEVLNEGLENVNSLDDMLNHMKKTYYSYTNGTSNLINAPYDVRSDWTEYFPVNDNGEYDPINGSLENCTTEWMMNPNKKEELLFMIEQYNQVEFGSFQNTDGSWNFQKLREAAGSIDEFWISIYSVAVDCVNKKMKIRFFEDETKQLEFSI